MRLTCSLDLQKEQKNSNLVSLLHSSCHVLAVLFVFFVLKDLQLFTLSGLLVMPPLISFPYQNPSG